MMKFLKIVVIGYLVLAILEKFFEDK